ncbi:helix-turn-helix transcriptional regulator [Deinococcus aquaedulcis]|nr:LuxR C-terminal-related transcriptional regulator [Deinococcus aquaedulcis]
MNGLAIARKLGVSINTLRTHTQRMYDKLGVNSRRAAVRRASDLGLS